MRVIVFAVMANFRNEPILPTFQTAHPQDNPKLNSVVMDSLSNLEHAAFSVVVMKVYWY